jgi:hypothetical protein
MLLLVAACGETNSRYAGLKSDEAASAAHKRIVRMAPQETFPRRFVESVKTKRPHGMDAWLVRVSDQEDSLDACVYVWKQAGKKTRLQLDDSCRHWKY